MNSGDNLTEIFKLIEYSEKLVDEKKRLLGDLQNQTYICVERTSSLKKSNSEDLKKLEDSERELASLQQDLRFFDGRCILLTEKRQSLDEEINCSKNNLKEIEQAIDEERQNFNKIADNFLNCHDVSGRNVEKRKAEAREKLKAILSQINDLTNEIGHLEKDNEENLENQMKIEELNRTYAEKFNETRELERKKKEISNLLDNDPEYKKMNEELKFYREQNFKAQCQELSEELNFLQNRYSLLCPSASFELKIKEGMGKRRHSESGNHSHAN